VLELHAPPLDLPVHHQGEHDHPPQRQGEEEVEPGSRRRRREGGAGRSIGDCASQHGRRGGGRPSGNSLYYITPTDPPEPVARQPALTDPVSHSWCYPQRSFGGSRRSTEDCDRIVVPGARSHPGTTKSFLRASPCSSDAP
jgi:hypothetical protein